MTYTLPSGTTAVPRQKILATRWNAAFNSLAACLNSKRDTTALVETQYGGLNIDASAKSGLVHLSNGVVAFESGTIFVDAAGADPLGARDSSSVVQALVNLGYRRILFNPNGTYLFNTAVTVPSLPNANTLSTGREIDGQGCRIVAANGIANAFVFTDAAYPNNHRHTKFHHFVMDGTCTGAMILWDARLSWYNDIYYIVSSTTASGTALVEIRNSNPTGNPGMFTLHHLFGGHPFKHTVLLSKDATPGALGSFDDFHMYDIVGGAYMENAAAITIDTGCILAHSHIHDVMSGGPHAVNAYGAYIQTSIIERIYLEVPATSPTLPTAFANNWGVVGDIVNSTVRNIFGYITNLIDHPGMKMVYANSWDSVISNVATYCVSCYEAGTNDAGRPYSLTVDYTVKANVGTTNYPAIHIVGGSGVTFDFPQDYIDRGILIGDVKNVHYLSGTLETGKNTTQALTRGWCYGGQVNNTGQGAGNVIVTLPAADAGMSVRFVMVGSSGGNYSIKAAPGDKIILNGTSLDDGDKITCAVPNVGSIVHLVAFQNGGLALNYWYYDWMAVTEGGTWTDGGA